jgi:hypothetical protein
MHMSKWTGQKLCMNTTQHSICSRTGITEAIESRPIHEA